MNNRKPLTNPSTRTADDLFELEVRRVIHGTPRMVGDEIGVAGRVFRNDAEGRHQSMLLSLAIDLGSHDHEIWD